MSSQELAIEYCNKAKEHAALAVDYAIKCGEELIKVKAELGHGEFLPWIEANMPVTRQYCSRYMKLAQHKELLTPDSHLEDLSIKSALEYIDEQLNGPKVQVDSSNGTRGFHLEDEVDSSNIHHGEYLEDEVVTPELSRRIILEDEVVTPDVNSSLQVEDEVDSSNGNSSFHLEDTSADIVSNYPTVSVIEKKKDRSWQIRNDLDRLFDTLIDIKNSDSITKDEELEIKKCIERILPALLVIKSKFNLDDRGYRDAS